MKDDAPRVDELLQELERLRAENSGLREELAQSASALASADNTAARVVLSGSPLEMLVAALLFQAKRAGLADRFGVRVVEDGQLVSIRVVETRSGEPWDRQRELQQDMTLFGPWPIDRSSPAGCVVLDGKPIRLDDSSGPEALTYPRLARVAEALRSQLLIRLGSLIAVPVKFAGETVGTLTFMRDEVRPYTDEELMEVEQYAEQIGLAIGNARAAEQLAQRTRELEEALERERATNEVLEVISRAPSDLQAALDAIVRSAVRLLNSGIAAFMRAGETHLEVVAGASDEAATAAGRASGVVLPSLESPVPRGRLDDPHMQAAIVYRERRPIHLWGGPDAIEKEHPLTAAVWRELGQRASLLVPVLSDRGVLGVLAVGKAAPEPYGAEEVRLLEGFARQGAIAIENARLFNELQERNREVSEALDQQTAMAEVLAIISRSPTNLEPVLQTIADTAARLLRADGASIWQAADGGIRLTTTSGSGSLQVGEFMSTERPLPSPTAFREHRLVRVHRGALSEQDIEELSHTPEVQRHGLFTTVMAAPLLRRAEAIGVLTTVRSEWDEGFNDSEAALLRTFADQAVIAIENARLFNELQERNREVTEALDQQTAMAEVLEVISRAPSDLQRALDAVVVKASRLLDSRAAVVVRLGPDGAPERVAIAVHGQITPHSRLDAPTSAPDDPRYQETGPVLMRFGGPDAIAEEYPQLARFWRETGTNSSLVAPLVTSSLRFGHLVVSRESAAPYTEEQTRLFETFANQAVIAIENARLFNELQERNREVTEALDTQTAMAEVLAIISQSATDAQPVLEAVVNRAARLCNAHAGYFQVVEGDASRIAVSFDEEGGDGEWLPAGFTAPVAGRVVGECIQTQKTIHFWGSPDEHEERFPETARLNREHGLKDVTVASVPMIRAGSVLGVLMLLRREIRPFTPQQLALLETFADQAAIAIENARLFNELQERNREVTEALDRQTAVSEVLEIISRSPADAREAMAEIALRAPAVCHADSANIQIFDGENLRLIATSVTGTELSAIEEERHTNPVSQEWLLRGEPIYVRDASRARDMAARAFGDQELRSAFIVPLRQGDRGLGVLTAYAKEVDGLNATDRALLETFADQAVIAMENARLFNELEERNREVTKALERQTAMSEVLAIISESATDAQPVLDAVTARAATLCDAQQALISFVKDGYSWPVSRYAREGLALVPAVAEPAPIAGRLTGEAVLTRRPVHFADSLDALERTYPNAVQFTRPFASDRVTVLTLPLGREEEVIGVLQAMRDDGIPFTDAQVALLEAFADQAVIAIENARLFNELQERNREVTEALRREEATGAILRQISSAPEDLDATLQAITDAATRLTGSSTSIGLLDGDEVAWRGQSFAPGDEQIDIRGVRSRPGGLSAEVLRTRKARVVNAVELGALPEQERARAQALGLRAVGSVPITRGATALGVLGVGNSSGAPITADMMAVLESFADQAAIAIENARLIRELRESNREVGEALDQQRASAAVLAMISRSPGHVEEVLVEVARESMRLCGADESYIAIARPDGGIRRMDITAAGVSWYDLREFGLSPTRPADRAYLEERTVHVYGTTGEMLAQYPDLLNPPPNGLTVLSTPFRAGRGVLGFLNVRRLEVRPFSEREIAVLEGFADQAVIAIENARLFNELEERNREVSQALDQQTAMAEVLEIISRSARDAQPVLDAVTERAAELCGADEGLFLLIEGDIARPLSRYVRDGVPLEPYPSEPASIEGRHVGGAVAQRRVLHFYGTMEELGREFPRAPQFARPFTTDRITILSVPLIRDEQVIGALQTIRADGTPYSEKQVALIETFADQAIIAIENARLFNELEERTQELEIASRHKSEFLANMSHELRTPLNAIIGYAELLQEECTDLGTEELLPDLGRIHSAGKHLLTLISGILDLAKVESGRMDLYVEEFDLRALVQEVESIIRPLVEKNGNTLSIVCPAGTGTMQADLVKVRQVLFNLLSNAAKFTQRGTVELEVRRDGGGGDVRFCVRDTGIGITEEHKARLFEAFSQADASTTRKYGGTGLGLALSRQFCLMMGGDISVESTPGEGSTFTVSLPAVVTDPVAPIGEHS